jgi:outer membrane protein
MKNKTSIILFLIAIAFSSGLFFYLNSKINKVVVIDAIKVFNEFKMKKDLEAKVEVKLKGYTEQLDSMKAIVDNALQRNDSATAIAVSGHLQSLQDEVSRAFQVSNQAINEQVWKRLNPLIDEYGKKEGYRVIIGANGMGSVLYKDDAVDRTGSVIKFINIKYEKGE